LGGTEINAHGYYEMIKSMDDYKELATMADTAEDCIQSLRFGSHAFLIRLLREKYGIITDRMGSIKEARRLCREYLDGLHYEELA